MARWEYGDRRDQRITLFLANKSSVVNSFDPIDSFHKLNFKFLVKGYTPLLCQEISSIIDI